jgi:NAD(P)-dependent dehydrogenase (short-subunit alcohol dehydrogenase family)
VKGRVAIVTGASGGIGEAIAVAFAREGARVVVTARRTAELERVVARIEAGGGSAVAVACDLTRESDIVELFAATVRRFGRLDVLVNNAGKQGPGATDTLTLDFWNEVLAVNVTAPFLTSREAIKIMKAQDPQGGRIINIGSQAGITPRPNSLAYSTSKRALVGLTHALTLDGRAYNVTASIINPGNTLTHTTGPKVPPGARDIMAADDVARVAVLMATLPPEVNLYEAILLPNEMPSFVGRG